MNKRKKETGRDEKEKIITGNKETNVSLRIGPYSVHTSEVTRTHKKVPLLSNEGDHRVSLVVNFFPIPHDTSC